MKKILSLLLAITFFTNGISQNLISPNSLTTTPTNSFYSSSQSLCLDGSGLSSIPTDVSSALTVTHDAPASVFTNATHTSNNIFETSWNFSFTSPKNIKGIALWLPCSAHNGGDAPFKKISIFNGTSIDIFNFDHPSESVQIVNFSSTYVGVTTLTINILETWHDLSQTSSSCGAAGWGVYTPSSSLHPLYNVMLGEIMFIEDNR